VGLKSAGNESGYSAQSGAGSTIITNFKPRDLLDRTRRIWVYQTSFDFGVPKNLFRRMAVEMPVSTAQGFLSSHRISAERLLPIGQIADTLESGRDTTRVFAPTAGKSDR